MHAGRSGPSRFGHRPFKVILLQRTPPWRGRERARDGVLQGSLPLRGRCPPPPTLPGSTWPVARQPEGSLSAGQLTAAPCSGLPSLGRLHGGTWFLAAPRGGSTPPWYGTPNPFGSAARHQTAGPPDRPPRQPHAHTRTGLPSAARPPRGVTCCDRLRPPPRSVAEHRAVRVTVWTSAGTPPPPPLPRRAALSLKRRAPC